MPIPKIIVTAALMAAQVAIGMSQRFRGPRLDTLKTTTAEYGTPIPRFWGKRKFDAPIIWAEDLREVKKTSKGKGGKQTAYKYYASFAFLICDHEIEAVTRIWFDEKLVYDATGTGPISLGAMIATSLGLTGTETTVAPGRNMRVYLGTETQTADPRMEAWCEDRYGPDSCPAYRGSAYVVIEDLPVNNFGNRIPQIRVEAVSLKDLSYPYEVKDTDTGDDIAFAPIGLAAIASTAGGDIEWWDVATRTKLGKSDGPGFLVGMQSNTALAPDGTAYQFGLILPSGHNFLAITPPVGVPTTTDLGIGTLLCTVARFVGSSSYGMFATDTGYVQNGALVSHSQSLRDVCVDADGETAKLFHPSGSSNQFTIECAAGTFTVTGSASARSGPTSALICYGYDHFCVISDGYFYAIDPSDGSIISSVAVSGTARFDQTSAARRSFWIFSTNPYQERSLDDGSLIRSVDPNDWAQAPGYSHAYDEINHAIWGKSLFGSDLVIDYLDRVDSQPVTLATVVDDVALWCGLTGQDTSALTQEINGYSVTQGSGKDMLDPLLTIHDVDARPHDHLIQFVIRGAVPSSTLLTEDFVRENGPRYTVTIQQDTDIPAEVLVNFADLNADQAPNTLNSKRVADAIDSTRTETIDGSTYAETPDNMQQYADRYLRRVWNERENITLSLTAQELALEPADVRYVSLDGEVRPARLKKMTITQSSINCEWIRSEPTLHNLNGATGAEQEGRDPDVIVISAISKGIVLDIPLITDGDNDINPVIYVAAGGYSDPYVGTIFLRGDDGTYDEEFGAVESDQEATWGIANNALGTANPNLWDRGRSVNVNFLNGTPTSTTEAAIDADPTVNLAAIGADDRWEIINFTTATLQGDGSYTLSGFKRGRRGTEMNVGNHAGGDTVVLLSGALKKELASDDIGDALSFKAVSPGHSDELAPATDITFDANSLKPYAPARLKTYYDGTDLICTIIRRTRVGGSWSGGSTIPLSENSEEYEVDVYNGATFKRTITVSGTNAFTYTAAFAAADGITLPTQPTFYVYQMSDAVGRGFALAA